MHEKPVHRDAPIINGPMWNSIICGGLFMAIYSFFFLTVDTIQQMFGREALHPSTPPVDEEHDAAASETPHELHGQVTVTMIDIHIHVTLVLGLTILIWR